MAERVRFLECFAGVAPNRVAGFLRPQSYGAVSAEYFRTVWDDAVRCGLVTLGKHRTAPYLEQRTRLWRPSGLSIDLHCCEYARYDKGTVTVAPGRPNLHDWRGSLAVTITSTQYRLGSRYYSVNVWELAAVLFIWKHCHVYIEGYSNIVILIEILILTVRMLVLVMVILVVIVIVIVIMLYW